MLFNSWQFLVFFLVLAFAYFFSTHVVKKNLFTQILLLCSSLFFYACWNVSYLCLILFSIVVTFASGIYMEKWQNHKKIILISSLVMNLGILFFFKYFNFFTATLNSLFPSVQAPTFNVLLPVGISFYTFQALGYSIDVYRGTVKAERNFVTYALFVTFFPQLVAGPIERTGNLLPQFKVNHTFDYKRVTDGLKLAAWGMFKKIVIADRLAFYVTQVYSDIAQASNVSVLLATFFFAFQILCDFSGYSDIAIGVAKVLGFNLMKNFNRPYFSKSIAEFWRRWHISLSTWFKDYVYIPLGGNKVCLSRGCLNLLITFLVSGLWHGASFTFILWGALHGIYQVVGKLTRKLRFSIQVKLKLRQNEKTCRVWQFFQVAFTFSLVCVAWVFFRANTVSDAFLALQKVFLGIVDIPKDILGILARTISFGVGFFGKYTIGMPKIDFLVLFVLVGILIFVDLITRKKNGIDLINSLPIVVRWICYYAVIMVMLAVVLFSLPSAEFIYFQF